MSVISKSRGRVELRPDEYVVAISWHVAQVCPLGCRSIWSTEHRSADPKHETVQLGAWAPAGSLSKGTSGPRGTVTRLNKDKSPDDPTRAFIGVVRLGEVERLDDDAESRYQQQENLAQTAMTRAAEAQTQARSAEPTAPPKPPRRGAFPKVGTCSRCRGRKTVRGPVYGVPPISCPDCQGSGTQPLTERERLAAVERVEQSYQRRLAEYESARKS